VHIHLDFKYQVVSSSTYIDQLPRFLDNDIWYDYDTINIGTIMYHSLELESTYPHRKIIYNSLVTIASWN
jgi:hypothetical protein